MKKTFKTVVLLIFSVILAVIIQGRTQLQPMIPDGVGSSADDSETELPKSYGGEIKLNSNLYTDICNGASYNGSSITIDKPGTYTVSGTIDDTNIVITANEVTLILSDIEISCCNYPVINCIASNGIHIVSTGSNNNINCSCSDNSVVSAMYSDSDITVDGEAALNITCDICGINSLGDLSLSSSVHINSSGYGIVCDSLILDSPFATISAQETGIITTHKMAISNCNLNIDSYNDCLKCKKCEITSGVFSLLSERGRGINAEKSVIIVCDGVINSLDDGIKANDSIEITCDTLNITTGKDGMQSGEKGCDNGLVHIVSGTITICSYQRPIKSYGSFLMDSGTILGTGISSVTQLPSDESSCLGVAFKWKGEAGEEISVCGDSNSSVSLTSEYGYNNILFCSSDIVKDRLYQVNVSGSILDAIA